MAGYGSDFTWGTMTHQRSAQPDAIHELYGQPGAPTLRYWFGPMNMVDYHAEL